MAHNPGDSWTECPLLGTAFAPKHDCLSELSRHLRRERRRRSTYELQCEWQAPATKASYDVAVRRRDEGQHGRQTNIETTDRHRHDGVTVEWLRFGEPQDALNHYEIPPYTWSTQQAFTHAPDLHPTNSPADNTDGQPHQQPRRQRPPPTPPTAPPPTPTGSPHQQPRRQHRPAAPTDSPAANTDWQPPPAAPPPTPTGNPHGQPRCQHRPAASTDSPTGNTDRQPRPTAPAANTQPPLRAPPAAAPPHRQPGCKCPPTDLPRAPPPVPSPATKAIAPYRKRRATSHPTSVIPTLAARVEGTGSKWVERVREETSSVTLIGSVRDVRGYGAQTVLVP